MDIRQERDALIIVDQQLDFQPGGALPVNDGDAIVPQINELASRFTEVICTQDHHPSGHISFVSSYNGRDPYSAVTLEDVQNGVVELSSTAAFSMNDLAEYLGNARNNQQVLWPDHCIIGTQGEQFDPRLNVTHATLVLRKGYRATADSYSAFRENDGATTGLAEMLSAKGIERVFVVGLAGDYCVYYTAIDGLEAGLDVVYVHNLTRFVGVPEGSELICRTELERRGVVLTTL